MKQVNLGFYRMVLFLLLGLFTSVIAYSQQISVKGSVELQYMIFGKSNKDQNEKKS